MSEERTYFAVFSHEYEDGPSGAARSYWDILYGAPEGSHRAVAASICLHHREHGQPKLTASDVAHMLNEAREAGRRDKAKEIREVIGT